MAQVASAAWIRFLQVFQYGVQEPCRTHGQVSSCFEKRAQVRGDRWGGLRECLGGLYTQGLRLLAKLHDWIQI